MWGCGCMRDGRGWGGRGCMVAGLQGCRVAGSSATGSKTLEVTMVPTPRLAEGRGWE